MKLFSRGRCGLAPVAHLADTQPSPNPDGKDVSSKQHQNPPRRSDFWASVRILLLIVLIAMITMVSQQLDVDPENLKIVGRITVTVGLLVVIYGLIKHISKLITVVAFLLLAGMVLVSEGLIDVPKFFA